MSIVLATTTDIAATPEEVWDVLSDFSACGEWSNFSRVDGTPEIGSKLKMRMPGFWFTSTVTAATDGHELQWSAKIITEGHFLGAHTFTLERKNDGTTRLHNAPKRSPERSPSPSRRSSQTITTMARTPRSTGH